MKISIEADKIIQMKISEFVKKKTQIKIDTRHLLLGLVIDEYDE